MTSEETRRIRQEEFITIYKSNYHNVRDACKRVGLDPSTFYKWKENDEYFQNRLEEARIDQIKYVESLGFKRMEEGSDRLIEFYLKTKGKSEGYGADKIETNFTFKVSLEKDNEKDNEKDDEEGE